MTAIPISQQRAFLKGSKVAGGVAGIPTSYYRKALDLNRFSNTVANKLLESYRRQIVKAVRELERIDRMPSSQRPEFKAARMRALIQQNLDSMRSWSKKSTEELIKQLDGLADVEVSFARNELAKVLPAQMQTSVRSVEVTESFAKALVEADPLDVGSNLLKQNIDEAVKGPGALLKLTARQGAIIRMPNGKSIAKSFRGLAESQGELFSRTVLDGLLTGESTASIARSLYGELGFSTEALTSRQIALAQKGNAWKMAKHQVRTLVQTSVNATSNAASMAVFKANPDITKQYRWVATLDSRTTPICRNLDQNVYEYGKGPTPANPPHFRCRSTTIPVVDWEGLGIDPPPNEQGYRPTKESKPNSAKPDGGRVPVDTSAASHIYGLRANTKSGSKSRFEPSAAQARMLGGGKDTPASRQKARYFNRLADRYGPDGAMQRFMREDGSEVSLKQLQSRYGDPAKITAAKAKAKPKPKPKPKTKPKPVAAAAPKPKAAAKPKPKAAAKPAASVADQIAAKEAKLKALNLEIFKADAKGVKELMPQFNDLKREIAELKGEKFVETKLVSKKKPTPKPKVEPKKPTKKLKFGETPKTTTDVAYDYKANWSGMYEKRHQFTKVVDDMDDWSGDGFKGVRAAQFKRAQDRGVNLSAWEKSRIKLLDKGEDKTYGRMADRIEDFIQRAPKYEGEIYRGAGFSDEQGALEYIRGMGQGSGSLTMDSWSANQGVANKFASGEALGFGGAVYDHRVVMKMPNKAGAPIETLSGVGAEREILQPSGVQYRVKEVTKKTTGKVTVYEVEMETL